MVAVVGESVFVDLFYLGQRMDEFVVAVEEVRNREKNRERDLPYGVFN